ADPLPRVLQPRARRAAEVEHAVHAALEDRVARVDLLELVHRARGESLALRLAVEAIAARAAVVELGHTRSRARRAMRLASRGGLLRSLERVLRANLFLADALAPVDRAGGRVGHDDVIVRGAGDRAADEDDVVLGQDAQQLQVLDRDLLGAHLARHALALVDALRGQPTADRSAVPEVLVRAVRGAHALHVVLLDHALEPLALAH